MDSAVTQGFSPIQLAVERVILKVAIHHHCDVIISNRLGALFSSKRWRMGKSIRSGGGTKAQNVKEQWKHSKWKIE